MTDGKLPTWFWVLAAAAVVWNIMGVGTYIADVTMTGEALEALPEAVRDFRNATPAWVTGAYAIAVFGGLAAALALTLRRKLAAPIFGVSLAAVVLQMGYLFIGMNAAAVLGSQAMILPAIIILISAFLLWFSISAKNKGWLR